MKATILIGDVRQRLKEIPDKTVQACITSPPYWGLRDYGTADWEGGNPDCEHSISMPTKWNDPKRGTQVLRPEVANRGGDSSSCHLCGATRIDRQIGLEQTPTEYVAGLVTVFEEVRRVLKDDGVLWLNLGDSYHGSWGNYSGTNRGHGTQREIDKGSLAPQKSYEGLESWRPPSSFTIAGLKPKDLVGIPWRVAFALQEAGWYLRQDIIWHKPNPMPESVTDRCTKAHEYLFMLTKSPRYYFDNHAIAEPAKYAGDDRGSRGDARRGTEMNSMSGITGETRNKRSVWSITTKPFRGAHFAVMPEALVEPAILASTSQAGQCAQCGTNLIRVIEKGEISERQTRDDTLGVIPGRNRTSRLNSVEMETIPKRTVGWKKQCDCSTDETTRNLVLDPFTGSGTVAVVALRNNHNFIGTELNPEYAKIAEDRIVLAAPMFNEVEIL